MAVKYQDWLATNLIAEEKPVTYRVLSRALKVHSHTAKQMLYDFHQTQNAHKPSSIYATYLLTGVRKPTVQPNGVNGGHKEAQDTAMAEASLMSSSMPEQEDPDTEKISTTSITLVKEENLEKFKAAYETITSIHVYSLSPGPLKDLQPLSECNRRIGTEYPSEDLLETWKTYGTIHNPSAQRRATRAPPPTAAPVTSITSGMKSASNANKPARPFSSASTKTSEPASQASSAASPASSTPAPAPSSKPPATKRESSSLFKSFGKTAASNAKLKMNTPGDGGDDDDAAMEDDEPAPEQTAEQRAKAEAAAKEKAARDAKLRAMMEGDEEEEKEKDEDEEMKEAWSESEPEPEPEPEAAQPVAEIAPAEQSITTSDGRRRGRRRVMKKKTTKDAEGYLVTKEEAAWESFSEDEAPKPAKVEVGESAAKKAKIEVPAKKAGTAGGGPAKKGQGNIMSFFKK